VEGDPAARDERRHGPEDEHQRWVAAARIRAAKWTAIPSMSFPALLDLAGVDVRADGQADLTSAQPCGPAHCDVSFG
jgi:hypothetical protein